MADRESMPYDVVIVGAGPAGLAAAIRLKQLAEAAGRELGGLRPRKGLRGRRAYPVGRGGRSAARSTSCCPNWRDLDSPLTVPVTENQHWVLTERQASTRSRTR